MRSKKCFIVGLTPAACLFGLHTALWGQESKDPNEEVKLLQEKIKQLEKTIESQQKRFNQLTARYNDIKKQLDEQIKENERLKDLLPKDKISPAMPAKTNFDPNDGIIYQGKKRNTRWFNIMYGKFCDKIVCLNGEYELLNINIRNDVNPAHMVWPIGTIVSFGYPSKVTSVVSKGEVLIRPDYDYNYSFPDIVVHIYGLDGDFVVGQQFPAELRSRLIYTGTFEYTAAQGRQMNVPSLTPYKPLTKEQFAEAINSGIDLIIRTENNGKITETPIR